MKKIISLSLLAVALSGCAYKGEISSVSGASEIMPSRSIGSNADVRIAEDISDVETRVNTGFVCSAHNYTLNAGPAISESIMRTLEGGFLSVSKVNNQQERPQTYFLDFTLSEFTPRIRFNQGFWAVTPEGDTELALKVRVFKPDGELSYQGTVRGSARSDIDGGSGCGGGIQVAEDATRRAIQRTMEDLAQKLFNSRILTDGA